MEKITSITAILAESSLKIWTMFLLLASKCAHERYVVNFIRLRMLIQTIVTLLALTMLLIEPAHRHAVFTKNMHELTLRSLLASFLHPMHANTLFAFSLVDFVVKSFKTRFQVIKAHQLSAWHVFILVHTIVAEAHLFI